jgi:hypothetical protein
MWYVYVYVYVCACACACVCVCVLCVCAYVQQKKGSNRTIMKRAVVNKVAVTACHFTIQSLLLLVKPYFTSKSLLCDNKRQQQKASTKDCNKRLQQKAATNKGRNASFSLSLSVCLGMCVCLCVCVVCVCVRLRCFRMTPTPFFCIEECCALFQRQVAKMPNSIFCHMLNSKLKIWRDVKTQKK